MKSTARRGAVPGCSTLLLTVAAVLAAAGVLGVGHPAPAPPAAVTRCRPRQRRAHWCRPRRRAHWCRPRRRLLRDEQGRLHRLASVDAPEHDDWLAR